VSFPALFTVQEGRRGAVVTLMAVLELLKAQLIDVVQGEESYAPLYLRGVEV
jgi:segregation and condensation protein A